MSLLDLQYLEWDSNFFEKKTCKIACKDTNFLQLNESIENAKHQHYDWIQLFSTLKVDFSLLDITTVKSLFSEQKRVYALNLNSTSDIEVFSQGLNIFNIKCNDQILNLAYQAGHKSRFKLDPNVSLDKFHELYTTWIEKSVKGILADIVFVFGDVDNPTGLITLKVDGNVCKIGLISVNKENRGMGIGRKLLNAAKSYCFSKGIFEIEVATQELNFVACKFYEDSGFSIKEVTYINHLWL